MEVLDAMRVGWAVLAARKHGLIPLLAAGAAWDDIVHGTGVTSDVLKPLVTLLLESGLVERANAQNSSFRLADETSFRLLADELGSVQVKGRTGLVEQRSLSQLVEEDLGVVCRGMAGGSAAERAEVIREIADAAGLREEFARAETYLEIGAGHGLLTLSLLEEFRELRATVVERSAAAVQELAAKARELDVCERLRIVEGDACSAAPENVFDVVYWSQAFFEPHARASVLQWLAKKVSERGFLFVFSYAELVADLSPEERRARLFERAVHASWTCAVLDSGMLVELLEQHGFELRERRRAWSEDTLLVFRRGPVVR